MGRNEALPSGKNPGGPQFVAMKFHCEDGIASASVYLAGLGRRLPLWVYLERPPAPGRAVLSPNQRRALRRLQSLPQLAATLSAALGPLQADLFARGRIRRRRPGRLILDALALPSQRQCRTPCAYLLGRCSWPLAPAPALAVEVEFFFANGQLCRAGELSGAYLFPH